MTLHLWRHQYPLNQPELNWFPLLMLLSKFDNQTFFESHVFLT